MYYGTYALPHVLFDYSWIPTMSAGEKSRQIHKTTAGKIGNIQVVARLRLLIDHAITTIALIKDVVLCINMALPPT